MSKSVLFAVVIAISATSLSSACDQCDGAPLQWVTGCCEHEPSPADHLWDDYCAEKNAPKSHCRRGCKSSCSAGCMNCSRWRPRPTGNFFGFGGMGAMGGSHGYGESYEAPLSLYLEEEVDHDDHEEAHEGDAPEAAEGIEETTEASAEVHGKGCQCPKCLAVSADAHGAGCQCPKCLAAADPAKHGAGCTCSACKAAAEAAEVDAAVEEAPVANDVLGDGVEATPGELTFELSAEGEDAQGNQDNSQDIGNGAAQTVEGAMNESEENAFDNPFGELEKEGFEDNNGFDNFDGFDAPEANPEILNEKSQEPESGSNFFGLGIELPSFGGATESEEMQD